MLPGIDSATRRRMYGGGGSDLFDSSSGSSMRFPELYSNPPSTGFYDESRLDTAAREAKRRLDQRLQVQPQSRSYNNGGWRQLSNVGSSWNSSEQDSCAVCLEQFDGYGALMQLPCGHRFHAHCLRPWLDTNADCPCCRMKFG